MEKPIPSHLSMMSFFIFLNLVLTVSQHLRPHWRKCKVTSKPVLQNVHTNEQQFLLKKKKKKKLFRCETIIYTPLAATESPASI